VAAIRDRLFSLWEKRRESILLRWQADHEILCAALGKLMPRHVSEPLNADYRTTWAEQAPIRKIPWRFFYREVQPLERPCHPSLGFAFGLQYGHLVWPTALHDDVLNDGLEPDVEEQFLLALRSVLGVESVEAATRRSEGMKLWALTGQPLARIVTAQASGEGALALATHSEGCFRVHYFNEQYLELLVLNIQTTATVS
jgi:hypothetical protein